MRLLRDTTLACVDTANHRLALRALDRSCRDIGFARTLFVTDRVPADVPVPPGIDVAFIEPLGSRDAYSEFVLKRLLPHVATTHVLLIQWDGYVVNAAAWDDDFLSCDYIGARWYWQPAGFRVGNGGFSLRSRKLLEALQDPRVVLKEAEDLTIGSTFRTLLERDHGIRFADEPTAERFSFEAAHPIGRPFGFHGLFNFARVVDDDDLAALATTFSDAIARSIQMGQLVRNTIALGKWKAATALADRRRAARPDDAEAAALAEHARAGASSASPASRNDPCPCGSGKRYKHCHGAVAAQPAPSADTLAQRAFDAHRRGDVVNAEQGYRAALAAEPDHPLALHYLGVISYQRGNPEAAWPMIERSVALRPQEAEFHNNAGLVLSALGRHDEAVVSFRKTLAANGQHVVAWGNLGLSLTSMNALPEAITALSRAIQIKPDYGEAHWNLALALLRRGDYARGFREYEWRHAIPALRGGPWPSGTRWTGGDLRGKTLLVIAEQGLGDTIHFLRFAQDLAARGARVIVEVPRVLAALTATAPGVAGVTIRGDPRPPHDLWIPLMSLAGALGLEAPPVAARVPYLATDPVRRRVAAAALVERAPRPPRIGLAWAGSRDNMSDRVRSCPLAQLAPLLARDDVAWVSLQKDVGEEQRSGVPEASRLIELDARNDFDGTAALIDALDLVVSVDTSLAHLAGALGRPVWLLLPYAPDWRWLDVRTDTPWYPTARLFRQPALGDWPGVVAAVGQALDRGIA